jgi:HPt (histidine-containing phosphotransfer) domain-containing protein
VINTSQTASTASQTPPRDPSACSFSIAGVHTREALARFAGDEDRYRHWLIEFISHGPAAASQIRQAITNGSLDTAIRLTHSLKGRTGMLGMLELHSIALSLEMTLINGEPTSIWVEELDRTVGDMGKAIAAELGNQLN